MLNKLYFKVIFFVLFDSVNNQGTQYFTANIYTIKEKELAYGTTSSVTFMLSVYEGHASAL